MGLKRLREKIISASCNIFNFPLPVKNMTYNQDQRKYILELYEQGCSGASAAKIFGDEFKTKIHAKTILSIWKSAGFKFSRGGHRSGLTEFEFLELYFFSSGYADVMAKKINCRIETITNRCKQLGLTFTKEKKLHKKIKYNYYSLLPDFIQAGGTKSDFYYCK